MKTVCLSVRRCNCDDVKTNEQECVFGYIEATTIFGLVQDRKENKQF